MKAYRTLLKTNFLILIAFAFIFVSCKDDDKTPDTVDNNEIVGKWQLTSIKPETTGASLPILDQLTTLVPCAYSLVFTFESNNKVTPSGCELAVQGLAAAGYLTVGQTTTWKVEGGTLKLTNGTTVQSVPLKQNGNEMTITVNTNTSGTGAAANALLLFKRI